MVEKIMALIPALYGILVLLSFIGWGSIAELALKSPLSGYGTRSFLGASLVIFLGGIVLLFAAAFPTTSAAIVGTGVLAFVACEAKRHRTAFPSLSLFGTTAFFLAAAFVLLVFLSYANGYWFNTADDYAGYLVWPQKILQTGSIGTDPFSQRRFSALGSNSFLQFLVVSFFPMQHISLIEPGVATLMIALLAWEKFPKFGWAAFSIFMVGVFSIIAPRANSSNVVMALGFTSALVLYEWENAEQKLNPSKIFTLLLLATPLVSLKGNVAPFAPMSLAVFFGSRVLLRRKIVDDLIAVAWAIPLYFLLVLPWLVVAYPSVGTWYYPVTGKGYFVTAYHDVDGLMRVSKDKLSIYWALSNTTNYPGFLAALLVFLGLLVGNFGAKVRWLYAAWAIAAYLLVLFFLERVRKSLVAWLILGILGAAFLAWKNKKKISKNTLVLGTQLGGVWLCGVAVYMAVNGGLYQRYFFTLAYAGLFSSLIAALSQLHAEKFTRIYMAFLCAVAFLFSTYEISFDGSPSNLIGQPKVFAEKFAWHWHNAFHGPADAHARIPPEPGKPWMYEDLQASVPPGKLILVHLLFNFAVDFKRNPIWVADMPGESSPAPGVPYKKGAVAFGDYMKAQGVCYIAYSYSSAHGFKNMEESRLNHYYAWIRAEARMSQDFQDNIEGLSKLYPVIFDDGDHMMVKLCEG